MVLTIEPAGQFQWGGVNFSHTASGTYLEGSHFLTAILKNYDGSDSDRQYLDLNLYIENQDGVLHYGKHPLPQVPLPCQCLSDTSGSKRCLLAA